MMKRSEYERRRDTENLELLEDAGEGGSVASSEPPPQETVDKEQARDCGGGNRPMSTGGQEVIGTSDAMAEGVQCNSASDDASSKATGEVRVRIHMPKNWLHTYSLAFACFGPYSDNRDPDIDLKMSNGLEEVDDAASAATSSEGGAHGQAKESRPLTGRVFADEKVSRA